MADKTFDIDPELLSGFIDDSLDDLAMLDNLFVQLEEEPDNLETISAIFRPIHSIKGNSAFFGLMKVKKLAHEMETLLDLARKEQLVTNRPVIDVLLAGVDELKEMLTRTREGQSETAGEVGFRELLERVISARDAKEDASAVVSDLFEKLEKLKKDSSELESLHLDELDAIISITSSLMKDTLPTEEEPGGAERTVPEALEKIKFIVGQPCEDKVSDTDSHTVLACLEELKELTGNPEAQKTLDAALDDYHTMVDTVGFDSLLCELLLEKMALLSSGGMWESSSGEIAEGSAQSETEERKPDAAEAKSKQANESQRTMRVSEDSIDSFLSYVGELIVIGEMYSHLQKETSESKNVSDLAVKLKRVNEAFGNLSNSLQQSIMEIRKVPVRVLLQKAPRMIRDIASSCGKDIKVELQGEDIQVDKCLIETLDAPLTHMVRNAADHGIEMPDERKSFGKSPQGTVRVTVTESEDHIVLAISDDGKGLDYEAIKAKAVKVGLIKPEQELSEDQITDLLFASGVSTAEKVTDVSGRGVGMDVVRRNIAQANGEITISSTAGEGSEFSIRLPKSVSTQIIDGYLVRICGNSYVIPLDKVREVFRPTLQEISTVIGKGECVLRHEKLLPVVTLFGICSTRGNQETDATMVSLDLGNTQIALQVDEVIGIQRVVLKDLDGLELNSEVFSAAAMMGDGSVAMVLDTEWLVQINAVASA